MKTGSRVTGIVTLILAFMASVSIALGQPAYAASGGGCSTADPRLSPCVSYGGGYVKADFYMNGYYDPSYYYYAYIEIRTTNVGNSGLVGPYTLNRNGRFPSSGYVQKYAVTLPPSSGSAINRVHIYTINWVYHGYRDSPRVYYP